MRLFLAALCLLLGGCGGKPAGIRVRIANVGNGLQTFCLPVSLAATLGYYKEEGLDAQLENLASSAKAMQALAGGSVDVAGLVYSQTIQVAAEGQRVRSFFIVNRRPSNVIIVSPSASGRIRRVEDLKGALVGVTSPGSASHLWTNFYLSAHGVRPSEFTPIGIGVGASGIAAIENGRVDAASMGGGDHFHLLRRHPDLRVLVDSSTPEGLRESYGTDAYAGGAVSAKRDWLEGNPDTARRLARALLRALQWIAAHKPEEIRDRLPDGFRSQDASVDVEIIRWGIAGYTADGRMPRGAPEAMRTYLEATVENVRKAKIDLAATWTNEFLPEGK